jgi:N-dimethylarginine dimethylaminohydrolase
MMNSRLCSFSFSHGNALMPKSLEIGFKNLEHLSPMVGNAVRERKLCAEKADEILQGQLDPSPSGQRILMCAPEHFGVDYIINPWMENQVGKTNRGLAREQWANLRQHLAEEAVIALVSPEPGLPDMVFTANAGMVIGKTAIVSRFRTKERQLEERLFHIWFEQHGFAIAPWPEDVPFEGAGDALLDRAQPLIWCGHGLRTSEVAPRLLENIFGRRAVGLRLVDPRFYHLDTCFCPLADGWLMYYPPAFDLASQETITMLVPPEKRIDVGEKDAFLFACNAVVINGRVFMNDASATLQSWVRAAGFKLTLTPLSEFIKAGGAAKCLTLTLVEV